MVSYFINLIESIVVPLGIFGVFAGSILEEVVAIIPSALTQMAYGFLLFNSVQLTTASFIHFFLVVGVGASFGVALGSIPWYLIARYGGKELLIRFGKYVFISAKDIEQMENALSQKKSLGSWGIFVGRSMPFIPSIVICGLAGILAVPIRTFIIFTFLGTLVRATIYGFIGWQLGIGYKKYALLFDRYENYVLCFLVIGFIFSILYLRNRKKLKSNRVQENI